ncbi:type II toxin-antitoxin system RelB/DinJ family antitoxin [Pseudomonas baltica]|uniref:type II toxin-antitoxin system RelB/DinJ family antitoxin n=1 Tax=Pseudomonas baltica TaxID=2762576 RepID=UPI00289C93CB|nr:type II toxin-antitoxin system RelB/DinJ family antitoxin [Pseudomonas baltica]
MPTKKKPELRKLPKIPAELLEQFADGMMTEDDEALISTVRERLANPQRVKVSLDHL